MTTTILVNLRDEVCDFYRHRDGSGISCHVDFTRRPKERALQTTLFVQGLPNNSTDFVDGRFRRSISHPAIEAAIVYEGETGNVTTVAKGGKAVHECFATRSLITCSKWTRSTLGSPKDGFAWTLLRTIECYRRILKRAFDP